MSDKSKVLLTGFTPFGTVSVNPSQLIVEALANYSPHLHSVVLPTEYHTAGRSIAELIQTHQPDVVMSLGVANRRKINLERIALNLDDTAQPDNSGYMAHGIRIFEEAPLAYWSTLPLEDLLRVSPVPAEISNHAGTYVCNHVFFVARHTAEQFPQPIRAGFIHVPPLVQHNPQIGMHLDEMLGAIKAYLHLFL